jgi:hypothetical protein
MRQPLLTNPAGEPGTSPGAEPIVVSTGRAAIANARLRLQSSRSRLSLVTDGLTASNPEAPRD